MIFEIINESIKKGEVYMIDGGFCHFHVRRDGQCTINEIFSTRKGAGTDMLKMLMELERVSSLFAKCPADLESNKWYERKGFILEGSETLNSGRVMNWWRLPVEWHCQEALF